MKLISQKIKNIVAGASVLSATAMLALPSAVVAAGGSSTRSPYNPYNPYNPPIQETGILGLELVPVIGIAIWVVAAVIIANNSALSNKLSQK